MEALVENIRIYDKYVWNYRIKTLCFDEMPKIKQNNRSKFFSRIKYQ